MKKYIVQILLMLVMFLFVVLPVYMATKPENVKSEIEVLDQGWTLTTSDEKFENATLSTLIFKMQNKGDVITLERTLPEASSVYSPVLDFYSVHSTVDVYLEDELLYSYGHDLFEQGKLLGYGDHFINLPADYSGKKLKIELTVTEDNALDGIPALKLSDGIGLARRTFAERKVDLLISLFLIVFGFILMFLSMIMVRNASNFTQTFCIAMFSFLIGCWTLCNTDLITFFVSNLRVKVFIEYMSFYLSSLPFTYYCKDKVYSKGVPKAYRIIFWGLIAVEIIYVLVAYLGQMFGVVHFPAMLSICHIMMLFAMLFTLAINVRDLKNLKVKKHINSIVVGFILACVVLALELIRFNFGKYLIGFSGNTYNSTLSIAVLIIIIAFLMDYAQSISNILMEDAKQRVLERLAYVDELTGLGNRRKCEDCLDELKNNQTDYLVISLDLNLLKEVNDTLGHDKGDEMLKAFADILVAVFGKKGTVGRMGGDEFIVIMPEVKENLADELVNQFIEELDKYNNQDTGINLSTAYGIACSDEADMDSDAHAAYRLADERMYENKRIQKMKK